MTNPFIPFLEENEPAKDQASWFQRQRVDLLLGELVRRYPMKLAAAFPVNPTGGSIIRCMASG